MPILCIWWGSASRAGKEPAGSQWVEKVSHLVLGNEERASGETCKTLRSTGGRILMSGGNKEGDLAEVFTLLMSLLPRCWYKP